MMFDVDAVKEYSRDPEELLKFPGFVPHKHFPNTCYLGRLTVNTAEELDSFISVVGTVIIYDTRLITIYNGDVE